MPTENEFKFVLRLGTDARVPENCDYYFLDQGYLTDDGSLRLRSEYNSKNNPTNKYYLTYKTQSASNDRLVEIETEIDHRDWLDMQHRQLRRLNKCRCVPKDFPNWCIDFFRKYDTIYFVMAEVELPEGETPTEIPSFITDNLMYSVPQSDNRFTSSKLYNREYAEYLYKWCQVGHN